MRRARRRPEGALGRHVLGIGLIVALAIGLVAALAASLLIRPKAIDPETFCAVNAPPRAHTILLVDASDALAKRHEKRLQAALETERLRLRPGDRLSVAALRPQDGREPEILASLCHPGDGASANPLFADTIAAQERYERAFASPLARAVTAARRPPEADGTPLIDALVTLAADPSFSAASESRRLVIVSDMLERRDGLNFYRDAPAFAEWRTSADAAGRSPALAGAEVRVVRIDRPEAAAAQSAAMERFWRPFFAEAGASLSVDP